MQNVVRVASWDAIGKRKRGQVTLSVEQDEQSRRKMNERSNFYVGAR